MNTFNKGYTLIEILITLALLVILTGIATISYSGYVVSINKQDMNTAGKLFTMAVKNCVAASGDWQIKNGVGDPVWPCKILDTDTAQLKKKLKDRFNFDCPDKATCNTLVKPKSTDPDSLDKWYCLRIDKTISGKNFQVFTIIDIENLKSQIWCKDKIIGIHQKQCEFDQAKLQNKNFTQPCPW